ncbi:hypothetical protein ACVWW3_005982 [Bradyrhizobium sp. LM2.9]
MSSLCGPLMFGKRSFRSATISRGVVDRQRGLSHEGEVVRILRRNGLGVLGGLDQGDGADGELAERTDHLRVMGMADQEDFAAALEMDRGLAVHLGHQRAGRIQRKQIARRGVGRNRFRHAMGREHHRRSGVFRDLGKLLDEDRALLLQPVDDVFIVHNLVANIDGGAVFIERPFHGVDRPDHPGTEATGRTKHDLKVWFG